MKFASLGSGSSGNATVIACGDVVLLVDCGFGIKDTERRLARLGLEAKDISAIVVTHEHSDHIKGVAPLARKYKMPVYMTRGTFLAREYGNIPSLHLIENYQPFSIAHLLITPVAVPHDAREPAQYTITSPDYGILGVLTDLGYITPHVVEAYLTCDALLVEANHDLDMLARGPYPYSLRQRVASNWGHLNNQQTANLLSQLPLLNLQHLVVGHISQKNNTVELAAKSIDNILPQPVLNRIHYACQDEGFDWLAITPKK